MTQTANHLVPEQGKLRRALAAAWAILQSLESTSFDYTLDRIERLEREVGRLQEDLQSRDAGAVDAPKVEAARLNRVGRATPLAKVGASVNSFVAENLS
jgi:hypothetical protein